MDRKSLAFGCKRILLALAGVAVASGPVIAQEYYGDSDQERVIVEAPYMHRHDIGPEAGSLLRRERISYSIPVSYADLDLADPSDAARLEARISNAAWEACHQLNRHYPPSVHIPLSSSEDRDCVARANEDGLEQARMVLAYSGR